MTHASISITLSAMLALTACQPALDPDAVCDGVPAEFGGCDAVQPSFVAATCQGVAVEFGVQLNDRIDQILRSSTIENGKARSVRIIDAEYLLVSRLDQYIDARGIGPCAGSDVLSWAMPSFSGSVREGVGPALSDSGVDRDFDFFIEDLERTLRNLDS